MHQRLDRAQDPGSERAKQRRDAAGITTPRQRIARLVDEGSFVEMGALGQTPGDPDAPYGDGVVTGTARINGRPVAVYAHDKSVYGGSVGVTFGKKVCALMDIADRVGCPIIGVQDSGGARIQDAVTSLAMYSEIARRQIPLSGRSPQISVMLGKCAGGAVYAPVTTDFVVAVRDRAELFITGPEVIRSVTGENISAAELGGAEQQARNGNVSYVADSEDDAFDYVHDLLDHLPNTMQEPLPAYWAPSDELTDRDTSLDTIIPDDPNAGFDIMEVLTRIFDDEDFLEVQADYAPNLVTGFARVDGRTVGVLANQPMHLAGCLDAECSDKGARFSQICDAYNIPLVYVVDTPGYLPGVQQEKAGIIHRGAKLGYVLAQVSVPKVTVIVRKAFGGAYAVMGSKNLGADLNFAWPTAQIAVMGAEAAVIMLKGKELAQLPVEQQAAAKKMFIDYYNDNMTSPYVAAERGYIDAMIQPRDTRVQLRRALAQLRDKQPPQMWKKHEIFPM
nr:acyl-CoA carboxylase subunit beta [Corynebacterium sp. TAE3-ERU12]